MNLDHLSEGSPSAYLHSSVRWWLIHSFQNCYILYWCIILLKTEFTSYRNMQQHSKDCRNFCAWGKKNTTERKGREKKGGNNGNDEWMKEGRSEVARWALRKEGRKWGKKETSLASGRIEGMEESRKERKGKESNLRGDSRNWEEDVG